MEQTGNKSSTKKRNLVIGIFIGVAAAALAYYGVQEYIKQAALNKKLVEDAHEMNKSCPMMVDKDTRLDNAAALPGPTFQYNYTLVNLQKKEINLDTVRKYFVPGLIYNVKTNPELKEYRDSEVTIAYNYQDKNGLFVIKVSVTPDMYVHE